MDEIKLDVNIYYPKYLSLKFSNIIIMDDPLRPDIRILKVKEEVE